MYYSLNSFFPQITAFHGVMFPGSTTLWEALWCEPNVEPQTHPSGRAVGYVVAFQMEFIMGKGV